MPIHYRIQDRTRRKIGGQTETRTRNIQNVGLAHYPVVLSAQSSGRTGINRPAHPPRHYLVVKEPNTLAEREGFEPPDTLSSVNGFQDRRFQPLCHLSKILVGKTGIEPARGITPLAPQAKASASFATCPKRRAHSTVLCHSSRRTRKGFEPPRAPEGALPVFGARNRS